MNALPPTLSIVIPTYNRAGLLRACLVSLSKQTQPGADYEVIVVMDGSTDDSQSMMTGLRPPYHLRRMWQANAGASAARNHGARLARGEWVLFLDDDMQADPELVAAYLAAARSQGPALLLGQVVTRLAPGADWFAREFGREWAEHYAALNGGRAPTWQDCYAGSVAVPRGALEQSGGWAEDLRRNEDLEFGYRIQKLGLPLRYVAGALSTQDLDKGFRQLTTDVLKTGAASVAMQRRHPELLPAQLGRFGETNWTDMLARRAVLGLRLPPAALGWLGRLLRQPEARWRWYRFVYSCAFWRGVRAAMPADEWQRLTSGTVILMYHGFSAPGEAWGRFTLPVRRFEQHMAWLKFWRYNVISLDEYLDYRRQHRLSPPRSVVITIDDGYADNETLALPVLRRYGFPATIFLVSQHLGGANEWDRGK
ncbi:MAG: glycosyltransferase, partial [Anaerolineales bacterium]